MNFYPNMGMMPGMPAPMGMPINMEQGFNDINNIFNRINEFDNRIKILEERVKKLEVNNKNMEYAEPDNSLYML